MQCYTLKILELLKNQFFWQFYFGAYFNEL